MFRPQYQPDPYHGQTNQAALQLPQRERPDQPGHARPDPAGQGGGGGPGLCRSQQYSREDTGGSLVTQIVLKLLRLSTRKKTAKRKVTVDGGWYSGKQNTVTDCQ